MYMKVQTQRVVLTGYKFVGVSSFCYIILFLFVQGTIVKEQNIIIARRGEGIKILFVNVFKRLYNGYNIRIYRLIGLEGRVFANGPGDLGSIPGRVIPKTLKMVLDTSLLNTQQYKVCIKGKVEQSRERSSALPYTSV